ncbi:hypothetical protein Tco_0542048 [Tanacetum coccineum]
MGMKLPRFFDNAIVVHQEGIMGSPRPSGRALKCRNGCGDLSTTARKVLRDDAIKLRSELDDLVFETTKDTSILNYQIRNEAKKRAMKRYRVVHRFSTAYHPQTNDQALKTCNMDLTKVGANSLLHINELDELKLDAYESSISYKERTKRWHDKWIKMSTNYEKGDKVLLFNSRLRLILGKLKSRWYGPLTVTKDMKSGAFKVHDGEGNEFIVNKQRVKLYQKEAVEFDADDDITLEDEGGVT